MLKIFKKPKDATVAATKPSESNILSDFKKEELIERPTVYCKKSNDCIQDIIDSNITNGEKNKLIKQIVAEDKIKVNTILDVLYFLRYKKNRSTSAYNQIINEFLTDDYKAQVDEAVNDIIRE